MLLRPCVIALVGGCPVSALGSVFSPRTGRRLSWRGGEATLLRLIFDDTWQPLHFTKLYDNDKAKIYRINY